MDQVPQAAGDWGEKKDPAKGPNKSIEPRLLRVQLLGLIPTEATPKFIMV